MGEAPPDMGEARESGGSRPIPITPQSRQRTDSGSVLLRNSVGVSPLSAMLHVHPGELPAWRTEPRLGVPGTDTRADKPVHK